MPIDLDPRDLETVRAILREHVPELEVRAFGSRVRRAPRATSDLDLVLVTERPLDLARMGALRDAFSESPLPFKVDLIDWATTSPEFRSVIEGHQVTVQLPASRATSG